MSWIERAQTKTTQPGERIQIVADASRLGDIRERAAGEHAVGGKEQAASRLDDRDATGCMTGRVKHAQAVVAQIDARHVFEPQVHAQRDFV